MWWHTTSAGGGDRRRPPQAWVGERPGRRPAGDRRARGARPRGRIRVSRGGRRGEILADLDGGRDQYGAEAGGIVDEQLRPRVPAEDRVLHPASRRRDVEMLAVPVEPVGAQVWASVAADPGDDDVTRLGEE